MKRLASSSYERWQEKDSGEPAIPIPKCRAKFASDNTETLRKRARRARDMAQRHVCEFAAQAFLFNSILKIPVEVASDVQRELRLGAVLLHCDANLQMVFTLTFYDHLLRDPAITKTMWKLFQRWCTMKFIVQRILSMRPQSGSPSKFWSMHAGTATLNAVHAASLDLVWKLVPILQTRWWQAT